MSYMYKIRTDKSMKIKDIQEIINSLPDNLSKLNNSKQKWGWVCACDVMKPDNNYIGIGGSDDISGNIKEEFVEYFKDKLIEHGYVVERILNS